MVMADNKRMAIIGAGISGLLACKYALSKNFHPIVFESRNDIGGLWTCTLSTTRLQTPKPIFQFSDFPWPESVTDDFPPHDQVLDYLKSYSKHFGLNKHIQLNTKVVGINYRGVTEEEMESWSSWGGNGEAFSSRGRWEVEVSRNGSCETEVFEVGFVILCVGKYSDVPNIPEFAPGKGPEVFRGRVMHSMEYSDLGGDEAGKLVKGKRVAVVGLQKHALDIAMECSSVNGKDNPCRVVYRREHWNVPDYMPWGFPLAKLYLNRFSELLVHKPGEGILLSFLATILAPLRWAISKFVESDIKHKHQLVKHGMVPKHGFLQEVSSCLISTVPEKFYDRVDEGSIKLTKAPSFSFCKEGIVVEGVVDKQEPLETDLVILATGFKGEKKLQDVFGSKRFREIIIGSSDTAVPLYRNCISPRIPQLAVLGFSESITNLFTSEMRCRWLAELLDGKFKLPEIKEMENEASRWDRYLKEYLGDNYKRSCIGAIHIWHNDQLCKDMGWNPKRKSGLWAELFEPYGPLDYVSP
ncbi:Probable flavin-containing monooxygenase 1 [Linum grandiflorum]